MPQVSVIVPVYKAEAFLDRCVNSVLDQSWTDFELILVNDGSPDRSGEICEEYARKDNRIRVFHKENGGQATARNLAIEWALNNSDSSWFAFIDSDDWVHRDYLKILMDGVKQHNVKVASCNFLCTSGHQEDIPVENPCFDRIDSETAIVEHYHMCMSPCCKLYAKELFSQVRFREGKRYEDAYITHIPVLEAGFVAIADIPLYYYFENPNSSTRKKWDVRNLDQIEAHEERVAYCRKNGFERAFRRELEALVISQYTQMTELQQAAKEDRSCREHIRKLRPSLLPSLQTARDQGLIPFTKGYLWIYEIAYPVKPLWVLRNLMEKYLGLSWPKE